MSGDAKEVIVIENIWVAGSRWKIALKKREVAGEESSIGVYLTRLYNAPNPEGYWMRDPSRGHQISLSMFMCRSARDFLERISPLILLRYPLFVFPPLPQLTVAHISPAAQRWTSLEALPHR